MTAFRNLLLARSSAALEVACNNNVQQSSSAEIAAPGDRLELFAVALGDPPGEECLSFGSLSWHTVESAGSRGIVKMRSSTNAATSSRVSWVKLLNLVSALGEIVMFMVDLFLFRLSLL
tara:strand:- start:3448 stop:3804 length:357 start_codon:yes stop_codon:yes gene_type:complete